VSDYLTIELQDKKRRRRERYIIIALCLVISGLVYLAIKSSEMGSDLPVSSSLLIFAVININVILLLLLLFLTVRNLVKLLFERRKGILGARIRTKLVIAFVTLSILPTVLLFFASAQFISSSIEYWFNLQIEGSLKKSLEVGQELYDRVGEDMAALGNGLSRNITHEGLMLSSRREDLQRLVEAKRKEYNLASLAVISQQYEIKATSLDNRIDLSMSQGPGADVLRGAIEKAVDMRTIQSFAHGDLVSVVLPVFSRTESKAVVGCLVLGKFIEGRLVNKLKGVAEGLKEYGQLKMLKRPIKMSQMITLSIVTLIIVFSSVWFGFYLSKEITVPIKELAEGTRRVASGDYDFTIDLSAKDEIGVLVDSFNRMTRDLKTSNSRLADANRELLRSNQELEQRRLYMEVVLANVAAGVVSADEEGTVLTINKSAERMLGIKANEVIGRNYKEILSDEHRGAVEAFLSDRALFRRGFLKRQIRIPSADRMLSVLVTLNVLRDDQGGYLGMVAVLEDLTEIEQGQRMAAWREVARRIAHEVKNPLTPIQLSAQRLRKRYGERLSGEDEKIFKECTDMIVKQVDELKRLVNEFSNFARMPASSPAPGDIRKIVEEAISLYREAHKGIRFDLEDPGGVPVFMFDRSQMKRVIINLLENAVEAMEGEGRVVIALGYDESLQTVRLTVSDTGRGIPVGQRMRIFEPYFSTKKHGTGLGLAIVETIISEHKGIIRVEENHPTGTRFIIELPAGSNGGKGVSV
jgi:two-component system nitrogen regulation sensor histidine kinase NtrY